MAFLTLFRVATGDNWNGIMKDTLRDDCDVAPDCVKNCCVSGIAPIFFVIFVLMAQFVLVNVVVAVLMKHLEESHKQVNIYIFFYLINILYFFKIFNFKNIKFLISLTNSMYVLCFICYLFCFLFYSLKMYIQVFLCVVI